MPEMQLGGKKVTDDTIRYALLFFSNKNNIELAPPSGNALSVLSDIETFVNNQIDDNGGGGGIKDDLKKDNEKLKGDWQKDTSGAKSWWKNKFGSN